MFYTFSNSHSRVRCRHIEKKPALRWQHRTAAISCHASDATTTTEASVDLLPKQGRADAGHDHLWKQIQIRQDARGATR